MSRGNSIDGLVVKAANAASRRQGAELFARAMGRPHPGVVSWLCEFSGMLADGGIGHFLAAHRKDRVVGYGALIAHIKVGWIGFMATEPQLQGRGIGSAVMQSLMHAARDMEIRTLRLDATEAGIRLYSKFGFEMEYPARRFEIPARCGPSGREPTRVRLAERLPEWCFEVDRHAFGDSRRALLNVALKRNGKALLAERHGFGILIGTRLGPVVADSADAAIDIVERAGSLGANAVYVPLHASMPKEFLAVLKGSEPQADVTCCTRMKLGEHVAEDLKSLFASHSAATG